MSLNRLNLMFFFFALAACSLSAQPSFKLYQSTDQIIWGEPDTLTLVLKTASNDVRWFAANDTVRKELEVMSYSVIDTGVFEEGWELKQELVITSFDTGFYVIPPFAVVVEGDSVFSNPLLLRVNDGVQQLEQEAKPIVGIMDEPLLWWEKLWSWGKYVLLVIVMLLIILWFRNVYLNNKNRSKDAPLVPQKSFRELFEAELASIEKDKDWERGHLKQFYVRVSDLLRKYLEFRFAIHAMEHTTSEIEGQLKITALNPIDQERLVSALRLSDMVKFAKGQGVEGQHEQMIGVLKNLVNHFGFGENEE